MRQPFAWGGSINEATIRPTGYVHSMYTIIACLEITKPAYNSINSRFRLFRPDTQLI